MRIIANKIFSDIPLLEWFNDDRYVEGVDALLRYADLKPSRSVSEMLHCSYTDCRNKNMLDGSVVRQHLLCHHFDKNYTYWDRHGEWIVDMADESLKILIYHRKHLVGTFCQLFKFSVGLFENFDGIYVMVFEFLLVNCRYK